MSEKNISFIIPAYNCAKTVAESVASILETNFNDGDEIIIVNDKSTDNTAEILEKLKSKNKFVKIIEHERNQGGGAARNTAVKNSKNNLIFCLDSDNILEKNSVTKLKKFLISSNSDVASFGELKYFQNDTKKISHRWLFKSGQILFEDIFCSYVVPPASGNYLFTKTIWEKAGGYPEFARCLDAWGFGFKQLAVGAKMTVLPNSYYFHRYGHESYWVRESNNGLSEIATKLAIPYKNLIEDSDWEYMTNNDWFNNIDNRPIKLKGKDTKKSGSIIYNKNLTKKIIEFSIPKVKKKFWKLTAKIKKIKNWLNFWQDYNNFKKINNERFPLSSKNIQMELGDKTSVTYFDQHYIYHPAWAARIIAQTKPEKHLDISSVLSFSTIVSAFIPVDFYDYRPAHLNLSQLETKSADLLKLPFADNSLKSLSCMHTLEHVGLGRYGDPLDANGDLRAMRELTRVLAPGGNLLIVVPVGAPQLKFNAHRIYSYQMILENFSELKLKEFSLIPDNAFEVGIINQADPSLVANQKYACGCFWFIK